MTPGRSIPGRGSRIGSEPVASTKRSNGNVVSSPTTTSRSCEIDGGRGGAGDQAHALAQVPGPLAEPAIALLDILRQQGGQQHPVVGRRRLGADDGDVEAPRGVLPEPLEQAQRRHAVADDDEPLAVHRAPPHAANAGAA